MIIDIHKLGPEGSDFVGEEPQGVLDLEPDSGVAADGPLQYALRAEIVSRELLVRGRMEMRLRLRCARCAVLFSTTLSESRFLRAYPLREGEDEVDVTEDLREALLLRLPSHPRCREDCAGLCARCGVNRNEQPCTCTPEPERPVWGALDGLELDRS